MSCLRSVEQLPLTSCLVLRTRCEKVKEKPKVTIYAGQFALPGVSTRWALLPVTSGFCGSTYDFPRPSVAEHGLLETAVSEDFGRCDDIV